MTENRPKVGIGVFVFRDGKFVMGQRRGSHGEEAGVYPWEQFLKSDFIADIKSAADASRNV
jgi:hypothetical protein